MNGSVVAANDKTVTTETSMKKTRPRSSTSIGHEECPFHHDMELEHRPPPREAFIPDLAKSYRDVLQNLGEDPTRQGLLKTPDRAARATIRPLETYLMTLYSTRIMTTWLS